MLFSFNPLFASLNPLVALRIVLSAARRRQAVGARGKGKDGLAHGVWFAWEGRRAGAAASKGSCKGDLTHMCFRSSFIAAACSVRRLWAWEEGC